MTNLALTTDEEAKPVGLRIVNRPSFWIEGGQWGGEGIENYPVGLCTCCGWVAPLWSTGESAACLLCHPANKKQRQSGKPLQCEAFCEEPVPLSVPARADPGGMVCCALCRGKIEKIRQRQRQPEQTQPVLLEMEAAASSAPGAFSIDQR